MAFHDRPRQDVEPVAQEDQAGHRACRGTAALHRDAEIGSPERQHVVDAVARHPDVVAGCPQRGDQAALILRPDPPEDAGAVRLDDQLLVVHGRDLQAGQDGARRDADGRGDRGHGRWVVAGDDP